MQETILKYAKGMGPVGEGELPLLEALCSAAEAELAGKLRPGLKPEDCSGTFPLAAAWLARGGTVRQPGSGGHPQVLVRRGGERDRGRLGRGAGRWPAGAGLPAHGPLSGR